MLSPDERNALWTQPRTPQYHAGVGDSVFKTFHIFDRAMTRGWARRRASPTTSSKAQVMAYENERAMFEAFSRNKYRSTGVIQWMLNNAWPSLHWNLFDWFLEPNGRPSARRSRTSRCTFSTRYVDRSVAVMTRPCTASTGLTGRRTGVRPAWSPSAGMSLQQST